MDFGYYRVISKAEGNHLKKVKDYTNLAYVGAGDAGFSDDTPETRAANMRTYLKQLAKGGLNIMLDMELHAPERLPFGQAIKAARPIWGKVKYIILADELPGEAYKDNKIATKVVKKINQLGLQQKPIGACFTPEQIETLDLSHVVCLDFILVEAYHDLGNPDPYNQIRTRLKKQLGKIAQHKDVAVVMQAYDRNGQFKDIKQMEHIQLATADISRDFGALAIVMFAYGRVGGTRDYPELQAVHKNISNTLQKKENLVL